MIRRMAMGRRLATAIPAAVIAAVAVLHWGGDFGRPSARAAMDRPASAPAAGRNGQPVWQTDWPSGEPRRNLFLTRLDNFPRDIGTVQQPMRPADPGSDTKSAGVSADQIHEAPQSGMAADVSQIHLQSTMMHPVPKALVNGQIVGEGDFVGSFRVVRITLSQIVLEKQGVQYPITLK
jgi:hypothetical protein